MASFELGDGRTRESARRDLAKDARVASFLLRQRHAEMHGRRAAIEGERREVLDVHVAAHRAVVLDVEPGERRARARGGDPLERRAELAARVAPGGAERHDDKTIRAGERGGQRGDVRG